MTRNVYISLIIMCLTVYAIRSLPLLLLRKNITNRWLRSFLYYVPFVTLAVMTFPAILGATNSLWSGLAALAAGVIVAYLTGNLFLVSVLCCAVVFLVELFV